VSTQDRAHRWRGLSVAVGRAAAGDRKDHPRLVARKVFKPFCVLIKLGRWEGVRG
jgi:hypothetical protein